MPEVCFCEGCADLQRQLQQAQAKLLEKAELHFVGPSVPRRMLDEVKAEHARRCDELTAKLQQAQEERKPCD